MDTPTIEKIRNMEFLKDLYQKTTKFFKSTLSPNMNGNPFEVTRSRSTGYRLSKEDLDLVIKIIQEDFLVFLPQEDMMGYINGYKVLNLEGKYVFQFWEDNLPKEITLESIFPYTQSIQNKEILRLLKEEKILFVKLHENFKDYCY